MKEDAERIHPHHAEESVAIVLRLDPGGRQPGEHPDQRDHARSFVVALGRKYRIDQHDEDAEDAQHQLWQDPNVVDCWNHRPNTVMNALETCVIAGAEACVAASTCFSATL